MCKGSTLVACWCAFGPFSSSSHDLEQQLGIWSGSGASEATAGRAYASINSVEQEMDNNFLAGHQQIGVVANLWFPYYDFKSPVAQPHLWFLTPSSIGAHVPQSSQIRVANQSGIVYSSFDSETSNHISYPGPLPKSPLRKNMLEAHHMLDIRKDAQSTSIRVLNHELHISRYTQANQKTHPTCQNITGMHPCIVTTSKRMLHITSMLWLGKPGVAVAR